MPTIAYLPIVLLCLTLATGSSLLIAWADSRHKARAERGKSLWQAMRLRNGVTEPSPWHAQTALVNVPGLVALTHLASGYRPTSAPLGAGADGGSPQHATAAPLPAWKAFIHHGSNQFRTRERTHRTLP
jgi:hypothetical protein